jgi:hypothetical protein
MSRAALKERFQGSDFVTLSTSEKKAAVLNTPNLPSLDIADDHDDDNDDNTRVAPINIGLLKDFMQKRVQKGMTMKVDKAKTDAM